MTETKTVSRAVLLEAWHSAPNDPDALFDALPVEPPADHDFTVDPEFCVYCGRHPWQVAVAAQYGIPTPCRARS